MEPSWSVAVVTTGKSEHIQMAELPFFPLAIVRLTELPRCGKLLQGKISLHLKVLGWSEGSRFRPMENTSRQVRPKVLSCGVQRHGNPLLRLIRWILNPLRFPPDGKPTRYRRNVARASDSGLGCRNSGAYR